MEAILSCTRRDAAPSDGAAGSTLNAMMERPGRATAAQGVTRQWEPVTAGNRPADSAGKVTRSGRGAGTDSWQPGTDRHF